MAPSKLSDTSSKTKTPSKTAQVKQRTSPEAKIDGAKTKAVAPNDLFKLVPKLEGKAPMAEIEKSSSFSSYNLFSPPPVKGKSLNDIERDFDHCFTLQNRKAASRTAVLQRPF